MVIKRGPKRPLALAGTPSAAWNAAAKRWEDGPYWYDGDVADKAAAFFPRYLRFTTGEWAGKPFTLERWQEHDIIRPLFGWKRLDGTRRYRICYVWVPRKNGKTELAAGVALLMLLGDAELGGQVFSIASDEAQATIVFEKATSMVQWSPDLAEKLECLKTAIYCSSLNASFKPLSGKPKGKHGLNMSGLIGDEIHEWVDDKLYTFVHQSTASRRQPLEFLISTFGEQSGYGWETWRWCEQVLDGVIEAPDVLIVAYRANLKADWKSPKTWAKANPNLGVSVKLDYLEAECAKARGSARLENHFKQYHLNIWTEQAVRWLAMDDWDRCKGEVDYAALRDLMKGRKCFGGMDLSQTTDLTAECLAFPPDDQIDKWVFLWRFFVPEKKIPKRVKTDRVPYDQWQREGALIATPGNVVDYNFVKEQLREDAKAFQIVNVGFDPWNAMQVMLDMQGEGMAVTQVRQGFQTLSGPSKELERLLLDCDFIHGGDPVAKWCASNVAVERDASGNIKPSKQKSTERIDGIAALVTALALAIGQEVEEEVDLDDFLKNAVMV